MESAATGRPAFARAAVVANVDDDFVTVDKLTEGSWNRLTISRACGDDPILRNRDNMGALLKKRLGAGREMSVRLESAAGRYALGKRLMDEAARELATGFGTLPRNIGWGVIAADLK